MADQNYFGKFGAAADDQEIGWEGTIEEDGSEYVLLEPGVYPFMVKSYDRKRYSPKAGSKIPACNQAVVHLIVRAPDGREAEVQTNLFLTKSQEWTLSAFFRSIGLKKRGEKLVMNWNAAPGRTGWVEIDNREYRDRKYNEVRRFIDPDKAPAEAPKPAGKGYTAGEF